MTHVLKVTTWHPYIDEIAGIFVLDQAAALQSAGADVGMIFSRIEGLRSFTLRRMMRGVPGVVHLDHPVPTIGFKTWALPNSLAWTPAVHMAALQRLHDAYLRSRGTPDILHGHVALEGGRVARELSRRTRIPYVITEHSSEILRGELTPQRIELARRIYRDAQHVIAVSDPLATRIRAICPSANVRVIGNLVRDFVFEARRPRRDDDSRLTVVTISSLGPGKRVHQAIQALARLPASLKARLTHVIIGEGRERARLEVVAERAGFPVEFRGNLPHHEAMSVLARADLLLHPSALETFGIVLVEALALGLPVVATRCGGPEGFLGDETGALVPPDDVDALAMATQALLLDIDRWRAKSEQLSAYAAQHFGQTSVARAIMETYT